VEAVRRLGAVVGYLLLLASATIAAEPGRPNVILILADDLGIGDVKATNPFSTIATPGLDRLAREGLTFRDAHTPSAVCTPTRYGLLTGRYNWRTTLARGVLSGTSPPLIPADQPTLAHLLKAAGYHTAMIGKWHLGWHWSRDAEGEIDFGAPVTGGPDANGFDDYSAFSASLDMPPYVWVENSRPTALPDRREGVTKQQDPYGWYREGPIAADFRIPEILPTVARRAVAHIERHAAAFTAGSEPFFLYLPLPAPHTPIVPQPPFKDASGLNPYADFVMQVDHHVSEILAALDRAGIAEHTLVIFTSDNGCSPDANFELLRRHGHDPSAGFRGHKTDIFEGGHRVPLVVRWPAVITGGRITDAVACLTDIFPTLAEAAGLRRPPELPGGEDGYSLRPIFHGKDGGESTGRETLVSHSGEGYFAIRQGRWKLCLCGGSGGWSEPTEPEAKRRGLPPVQLYDLETDPAETKNLQADHPDVVAGLIARLTAEVRRGRSTPGPELANDREVTFLPAGVTPPPAR
jgi:arylsulfatase A